MILSVSSENGKSVIKGVSDGANVVLKVDNTGKILDNSCSMQCGGICAHVVATALCFNDITLDHTDIAEQLSRFVVKSESQKAKFPCKIELNPKTGLVKVEENGDLQFGKLTNLLSGENALLLVSLAPEKFVLGTTQLFPAEIPMVLFYTLDSDTISFSLPKNVFYSERNGVAVDCDDGAVWRFSHGINETLSVLLGKSIEYSKKDTLMKSVSDLSESLKPDIVLSGEFNLEKIVLDDSTKVIFKTEIREGRVFLGIFLENGKTSIEFHPKKRSLEQNYPMGGRIYFLNDRLIKDIKSALAAEKF